MKTLQIENGDLVLDGQMNLQMVEGTDEEIQSIKLILHVNKGEWFLNVDHGLDYSAIQGKGKDKEDIKLALTEAITQDDRVDRVEYESVEINRQERKLNVVFKVFMKSGNVVEESEVLSV